MESEIAGIRVLHTSARTTTNLVVEEGYNSTAAQQEAINHLLDTCSSVHVTFDLFKK